MVKKKELFISPDEVDVNIKYGITLTPSMTNKKFEELMEESIFAMMVAYPFSKVINNPKTRMKRVREYIPDLLQLDDNDFPKDRKSIFTEEIYDAYLNDFIKKIESFPIIDMLHILETKDYLNSKSATKVVRGKSKMGSSDKEFPDKTVFATKSKDMFFSNSLLQNLKKSGSTLTNISNTTEFNKLIQYKYEKGISEKGRHIIPEDKRTSELMSSFDTSAPVLFKDLKKFITVVRGDDDILITIDTLGYFTRIFRKHGFGEVGKDNFQFKIGGKPTMTDEEKDAAMDSTKESGKKRIAYEKEQREKREQEIEDKEAEQEIGSELDISEDDTELSYKMLKSESRTGKHILSIMPRLDGKYIIEDWDTNHIESSIEEIFDAINSIDFDASSVKDKIEDAVFNQRKSNIKTIILDIITPENNAITIGKVVIKLKIKTWKDIDALSETLLQRESPVMVYDKKELEEHKASKVKDKKHPQGKLKGGFLDSELFQENMISVARQIEYMGKNFIELEELLGEDNIFLIDLFKGDSPKKLITNLEHFSVKLEEDIKQVREGNEIELTILDDNNKPMYFDLSDPKNYNKPYTGKQSSNIQDLKGEDSKGKKIKIGQKSTKIITHESEILEGLEEYKAVDDKLNYVALQALKELKQIMKDFIKNIGELSSKKKAGHALFSNIDYLTIWLHHMKDKTVNEIIIEIESHRDDNPTPTADKIKEELLASTWKIRSIHAKVESGGKDKNLETIAHPEGVEPSQLTMDIPIVKVSSINEKIKYHIDTRTYSLYNLGSGSSKTKHARYNKSSFGGGRFASSSRIKDAKKDKERINVEDMEDLLSLRNEYLKMKEMID